jgi:dephospho-CoA kinase
MCSDHRRRIGATSRAASEPVSETLARLRHDPTVPFTCEACGGRSWPQLLPARGEFLRCPSCGDERSFVRPLLLIVTGTVGIGKSTVCARLAGAIPGAILLDADLFAEELVSVVSPNPDYPAFWHSMMRLAHELAQNGARAIAYFSTMLPDQALANTDVLDYFESVRFLCLTCPPEVLATRLTRREPDARRDQIDRWVDFNARLAEAAARTPAATMIDASGTMDDVEERVRRWIADEFRGAKSSDRT